MVGTVSRLLGRGAVLVRDWSGRRWLLEVVDRTMTMPDLESGLSGNEKNRSQQRNYASSDRAHHHLEERWTC